MNIPLSIILLYYVIEYAIVNNCYTVIHFFFLEWFRNIQMQAMVVMNISLLMTFVYMVFLEKIIYSIYYTYSTCYIIYILFTKSI